MRNIAKSTIILMLATIIAKVLGFGRELVLASSYGASMYSDAYITAMNIPLVVFASIGTTLGTVLIPMYFKVENTLGNRESLKFINNTFNIVIVVCVLMSIVGIIFTEPLVKIFAVGFSGKTLDIAIDFTKITMISLVFTGLSYLMTAYLQIKGNFTTPGLISVPKNIVIIGSILLSIKYNPYIMIWGTLIGISLEFLFQLNFTTPGLISVPKNIVIIGSILLSIKYNPYIMIWGTLIGISLEFLFQLPYAIRNGYRYESYINIKDEYIKELAWLILPVLIGVAVNQVNSLVDRTLASTLAEGSISALNYANKLNGFVMALFIASIGSVIYPMLSKLSTDNNKEDFKLSVIRSINSVSLLVIPISVGAIVLSKPIVKLLFQRGEFDDRATYMTSIALLMYSIGMIAFGLRDILGKVFYSLQDTKTPMINGAIAMIMNIILNIILVNLIGLPGLPLATSISSIICIILLFNSLKKKIGDFGQTDIIKTTIKSIIAAIVMGIVTYFVYKFINNILGTRFIMEFISLFISIVLGAISYGILVIILKVDEVTIVTDMVKNKIRNK